MSKNDLGNRLNQIVRDASGALFDQGELAELAYGAFDLAARSVEETGEDEIDIKFPIGWNPDNTPLHGTKNYKKRELRRRYEFLALNQLSLNGVLHLVTIMEVMFGDIIRAIVAEYPQKLGAKRTIKLRSILESSTVEEIHLKAMDSLINELSYKSPRELAEFFEELISANLMECPAFHSYVEIKASRDIFLHNRGIANEIYERKAASHRRVTSGQKLPSDSVYFLKSYEACLQLCEWIERRLHEKWYSSTLEERDEQASKQDQQ